MIKSFIKQKWSGWIMLFPLLCIRCGIYSFSGSTLPSHIKTVGIPLFEDLTPEFGIDQEITDALIKVITNDNSLKIGRPRESNAQIRGRIMQVQDRAGQYSEDESAQDFRITISIHVTFEDMKKRKILWEENFSQWGAYSDNRDLGITEAVDKLAQDILNRTVSSW